MQRRSFIFGALATAAVSVPKVSTATVSFFAPTKLCLYHTHTNEFIEVEYSKWGGLLDSSLNRLNYFLRDYRTDQTKPMDPQLFDILYELQKYSHNDRGVFEIVSAYRSPETNSMLRRHSKGVARQSLHQYGQALDIRLRGTSISQVHRLAMDIQAGGVGYYPRANFVHVDTGSVRNW
ncbi:hypothetical protein TI04_00075 [Achromatium sp. WMS2]|nr:hypothetical protein TI04_00075 [Achromatium sp. WMS2]